MFSLFPIHRPRVGISFRAQALELVEVRRRWGMAPTVTRLATRSLPAGLLVPSSTAPNMADPAVVAKELQALLHGVGDRTVASDLPMACGTPVAALDRGAPVRIVTTIKNTDRTAGAMLSGEIAKRYGHEGLPHDTIHVKFTGTAGQSFGAWLARGVTFELEGDANDYVGKGLSGGRIVIRPAADAAIVPEESIIVGNTVLYGAIEGECYFRGVAGERFAVRNSGAIAVIEGAGDHCCEYMTGGIVVVLGKTGRNFAAGMSGGIAYVLDEDGTFERLCNMTMVELEPLPAEEEISAREYHHAQDLETSGWVEVLDDMTRYDVERLHLLISRHARLTGSKRAEQILADWPEYCQKFRKVMPVEYRRALAELEKARTMQAAE